MEKQTMADMIESAIERGCGRFGNFVLLNSADELAGAKEALTAEMIELIKAVAEDERFWIYHENTVGYTLEVPKFTRDKGMNIIIGDKIYARKLTFGQAIERMKDGERVSRIGWNGKGQYVFLAHEADFVTDADISAFDQLEVEVHDMLVLKTAQDTFQPGWLATQTDMLAEDWYVV